MTDLELKEIDDRASKATPGPWGIWEGPEYIGGGSDLCIGAAEDKWLINMDHRLCKNLQIHWEHKPDCEVEPFCSVASGISVEQRDNAEFIARAREDIPRLLAEVKRLQAVMRGGG